MNVLKIMTPVFYIMITEVLDDLEFQWKRR